MVLVLALAPSSLSTHQIGNAAYHNASLYSELGPAIPHLTALLHQPEDLAESGRMSVHVERGADKVKANAAGALGNMARNSNELCGALIKHGAVKVRF